MAANDSGLQKSAILLIALGEEIAPEVLKILSPGELQSVGHAMSSLSSVPRERIESVLDEFLALVDHESSLHTDTDNYIRSVLTKALGDDAGNLLSRIFRNGEINSIEGLKWVDAPVVADLIRNEHPQIIASILAHLDSDHASAILNLFTERLRNDVLLRIATLDGVQPQALKELNESLKVLSATSDTLKKSTVGGVRAAAEILNYIGQTNELAALDSIREYDEDLAQRIQDEMFVFENLLDLDDRSVQNLLREVQSDSLVLALKGTSEELREKIFKNMSQRASDMLREDLETRGPVRLSEVESVQKEILRVVRRMIESGEIVLTGAGSEPML